LKQLELSEKYKIEQENKRQLSIIAQQKYNDYWSKEHDIYFRNSIIDMKIYDDDFMILYKGKEYYFDNFLVEMYKDERVNKSIVFLENTIGKLLRIGQTQRIKLKYDILSYFHKLPYIDSEEIIALQSLFSRYYDCKAVQEYYRRLWWKDGLEKMVAFGADLSISGKLKSTIREFFCYRYNIENGKAYFDGVNTDLYNWLYAVKYKIICEI